MSDDEDVFELVFKKISPNEDEPFVNYSRLNFDLILNQKTTFEKIKFIRDFLERRMKATEYLFIYRIIRSTVENENIFHRSKLIEGLIPSRYAEFASLIINLVNLEDEQERIVRNQPCIKLPIEHDHDYIKPES